MGPCQPVTVPLDLSQPTLVVTGAAHGLGAAIASAATASGWTVGVLDHDEEATNQKVASLGADAVAMVADTTDEESVEAALDRFAIATHQPAPDAVVCNAGIIRFGPTWK